MIDSSQTIVPETFDYKKALTYLNDRNRTMAMIARRVGVSRTTLENWKYNGAKPAGDNVLKLINIAYQCLDDDKFGECAGFE